MSCIVKQKRKGTSTIYAYESQSYWVPNVGPRSRRKLIGKVDPVTGEIVPTGKRGRPRKVQDQATATGVSDIVTDDVIDSENELERVKRALIESISANQELESRINTLTDENRSLKAEVTKLQSQLNKIERYLEEARSSVLKTFDACIALNVDSFRK